MATKEIEIIGVEVDSPDEAVIEVTQLPIIKQRLIAIKEQFEREIQAARELACTEDTLKAVKEIRARLTKAFNEMEELRKQVKKQILAPYEALEEVYKSCITDIYKPCDKELADKIHEVENGLKAQKRKIAEEYFDEFSRAANIDFLTLDRVLVCVGLNIGLSTTKKAIRDSISLFITKVSEELVLIDTQEHSAEVLVEYKQSLNVAQAITLVTNRHKAMTEEQARIDLRRVKEDERAAAVERIDEIMTEIQAPTVMDIPENEASEPVYELSFVVRGTLGQLKALKAFLTDNGYDVRNGGDDNG